MIVNRSLAGFSLLAFSISLGACGSDEMADTTSASPQVFTRYSTSYVPFLRYTSVYLPHQNTPPIAAAGSEQTVNVWDAVILNGSGSTDADHDYLGYTWAFIIKPASSIATFDNSSLITPRFTPDVAGEYVIGLTVTDGKASSATSEVMITALPYVSPANLTDSTGSVAVVSNSFDYSYQTETNAMVIIRMKVITNDGSPHSFGVHYQALDSSGNVVYSNSLTGGAPNVFQTSTWLTLADYTRISRWVITKVEKYT